MIRSRRTRTTAGLVGGLLVLSALGPASGRAATEADMAEAESTGSSDVDPTLDEETLSPQTVVYYNARVALRERRYKEVVKLWLLRNTLESEGVDPTHDGDFRSVLWAALAGAGLCHDGIRDDDDRHGAGLWPLALHNWMIRSSSRQPAPPQPRAFTSFNTGFHQRHFALSGILNGEELKGARFFRKDCLRPYYALAQLGTPHWLDMDDRLSRGIMMRDLIERAQKTLKHERVWGEVVLETRLFDLEVALVKLAQRQAKRETGILAEVAKITGVSEPAMTLLRENRLAAVRQSNYSDLLRNCLAWDALNWNSLRLDRRLALYRESQDSLAEEPEMQQALDDALRLNIDAAIDAGDGAALNQWLGFAAPGEGSSGQSALIDSMTEGKRGERILALDRETGFRERGVIALRRGVNALGNGEPMEAMRSFALAMQRSEESRKSTEVHNLTRRWFSYVLAQHGVNEEVLAILDQYVTPVDKNELLEVLLWRAAFYADLPSFDRIAAGAKRGTALDFRIAKLRLLAGGDPGAMYRKVRKEMEKRPHGIYKFVAQLTEELATESLDVRLNNRATIELGMTLLSEIDLSVNRGLIKRIDAQKQRMQTLLDGINLYDESAQGRAIAATPGAAAYAGSVRLAPADPLPWPFSRPTVQAPSPFAPITLTPIEWIDETTGQRVFGWYLNES